ncbi:MAG: DUF934 domain-containing protein [Xylophilus ampelinus]
MKIITAAEHAAWSEQNPEARTRVLELANDADPAAVVFDGIDRIDLHFPKFTDGRAFSQAFLLRRRMGFRGELRATGDVLIDQLVQMARTGFDVAVLREGVDIADARRQFERFGGFYQGDAVNTLPHFKAPEPRPLPVDVHPAQAASA